MDQTRRLPRGLAEERILKALRWACAGHGKALTLAQLRQQTELSRGTVQEVVARLRKSGVVETRRECRDAAGARLLWVRLTDPTCGGA